MEFKNNQEFNIKKKISCDFNLLIRQVDLNLKHSVHSIEITKLAIFMRNGIFGIKNTESVKGTSVFLNRVPCTLSQKKKTLRNWNLGIFVLFDLFV